MSQEEIKPIRKLGPKFLIIVGTVLLLGLLYLFMVNHADSKGADFLEVEERKFYLTDTVIQGHSGKVLVDEILLSNGDKMIKTNPDGSQEAYFAPRATLIHDSLAASPLLINLVNQLERLE